MSASARSRAIVKGEEEFLHRAEGFFRVLLDPKTRTQAMKDNYSIFNRIFTSFGLTMKPMGEVTAESFLVEDGIFREYAKRFKSRSLRNTEDAKFFRTKLAELKRDASAAHGADKAVLEEMVAFLEMVEPHVVRANAVEVLSNGQTGGARLSWFTTLFLIAALMLATLSGYTAYHEGRKDRGPMVHALLEQVVPGVKWVGEMFKSGRNAWEEWGRKRTSIPEDLLPQLVRIPYTENSMTLDRQLQQFQIQSAEVPPEYEFSREAIGRDLEGRPYSLESFLSSANRQENIQRIRKELKEAQEQVDEYEKAIDKLQTELADLNNPQKSMQKRTSGVNTNKAKRNKQAEIQSRTNTLSTLRSTRNALTAEKEAFNVPRYIGPLPIHRLGEGVGPKLEEAFGKRFTTIVASINHLDEDVRSRTHRSVLMIEEQVKQLLADIQVDSPVVFQGLPEAYKKATIKYYDLTFKNMIIEKIVDNYQRAIAEESRAKLFAMQATESYDALKFYTYIMDRAAPKFEGNEKAFTQFQELVNGILDAMSEHGFQVAPSNYPAASRIIIDFGQREKGDQTMATLLKVDKRKQELYRPTSKRLTDAFWSFFEIIGPFMLGAALFEYFTRNVVVKVNSGNKEITARNLLTEMRAAGLLVAPQAQPPALPPAQQLVRGPDGQLYLLPAPPQGPAQILALPAAVGWPQALPGGPAAPLPAQGAPPALPNAGLAMVPAAAAAPAGRPRAGSVGPRRRQQVFVPGADGVLRLGNGVLGGARTLKRGLRQRRKTRRST